MSLKSDMELIEKLLEQHPDRWFSSSEIANEIKDVLPQNIYLAVSHMARKTGRLLRRNVEGTKTYEYGHNPVKPPEPKQPYAGTRKTFRPKQEGAPVHWNDEEKMKLAREIVRLREEMPHLPTSDVIIRAQSVLDEGRKRLYLRKAGDLPWLDTYISMAKASKPDPSPKPDIFEQIKAADAKAAQAEFLANQEREKNRVPFNNSLAEGLSGLKGKLQLRPVNHLVNQPTETKEEPQVQPDAYTESVLAAVEKQSEIPAEPAKPVTLESFGVDLLFGEIVRRMGAPIKDLIIDILSSPEVQRAFTIKTEVTVQHHHHHHNAPAVEEKQLEAFSEKIERRTEERPPRKKVGVVGNQTTMEADLTKSFPHIKFVVTDNKHNVAAEAVKNCDRIIVLTRFISHSTDANIRKVAGDRYSPVNGGLSDIRRIIQGWINSGVLPAS